MARDNYAVITNRIVEALEAGTVPWRRPWNVADRGALRNAHTGYVYRGINVPLLSLTAHARGYADPRWLTFKQARELGGHVRRGERGTSVVLWKWIRKEREDEGGELVTATYPILRTYTVFNAAQCADVELPALPEPEPREVPEIDAAERIVRAYPGGPRITHDGDNRAYYRPATDSVHLPTRERFESAEAFYAVTFHELAHSTGHRTRLDRPGVAEVAPFGSPDYSREELVAEFGAAFLCGEAGIVDPQLEQSAAYVDHWIRVLRGDTKLAVVAAAQAQRAADHILDRSFKED